MVKAPIQGEDITIINIYAPNIGAPQYVRQMLTRMKGEINSNTIIGEDFNTSLTTVDRSTKQIISKETQTLNDTIDQLDQIDIYRRVHCKTMNFTFFSSSRRTFSRIYHFQDRMFSRIYHFPGYTSGYILGHKSSLGKFKKIEIISRLFS